MRAQRQDQVQRRRGTTAPILQSTAVRTHGPSAEASPHLASPKETAVGRGSRSATHPLWTTTRALGHCSARARAGVGRREGGRGQCPETEAL